MDILALFGGNYSRVCGKVRILIQPCFTVLYIYKINLFFYSCRVEPPNTPSAVCWFSFYFWYHLPAQLICALESQGAPVNGLEAKIQWIALMQVKKVILLVHLTNISHG